MLTCSALKQSYRKLLAEAEGRVLFIHLHGEAGLLSQRMQGREGHFMPPTLLPSQLATLEPLSAEELEAGSLPPWTSPAPRRNSSGPSWPARCELSANHASSPRTTSSPPD